MVTKHVHILQEAYGKHPYGKAVVVLVDEILAKTSLRLAEINMALVRSFCQAMGISSTFHVSSRFSLGGHKSAHSLAICRHLAPIPT